MSQPTLDSNPEAWERRWQAKLDATYPARRAAFPSRDIFGDRIAGLTVTEDDHSVVAVDHKRLIDLQNDIQGMASVRMAEDDFASIWLGVGTAVRKKHYFEAMRRICEIPNMETQRGFCPEVSLKSFESNNGQGYLDLLLLASRERPANEYAYFHHKVADIVLDVPSPWNTSETYSSDPRLSFKRRFLQRRTLFISLILYNVMLSFYDIKESYVSDRAYHSGAVPKDFVADAVQELGRDGYKQLVREVRQTRQEHGHDVCAFCEKIDFQVPDAGRFKLCGKCKAIGRTVRYCSRECQVDHWKRGSPPHKLICGKPASEHAVSVDSTQSSNLTLFPPANPSYTRSPALLYLIKLLSESPELDYIFIQAYPEPDHGLRLANPMGQIFFRINRDRAFKSGDRQAVRVMWSFLLLQAENIFGYGREGLRSQLRKEFGFDPESVPPPTKGDEHVPI